MSLDRPSSTVHRASRAWLLSLAMCAVAAIPGTGRAHQQESRTEPQASAATSQELTGRLEVITVIGSAGGAQQYPMLVTNDGQRYKVENAGAAAIGATVTVSGRLSGHTMVADVVRGAAPQAPAIAPRSAQRGELTGTIRMFHMDYPDGTSEYGYSLIADSGRGNIIDLGTPLPGIENGARAKVSGPVDARGYVSVDTIEILAPPSHATIHPSATANAVAALGTTNYAVAPLQFPSNASAPFTYGGVPTTPGQINTSVFGVAPTKSAAEYYKEVSYGAQLLTGFVISGASNAWLQATVARPTSCTTSAQLDAVLATIEAEAKAKAATAANNPVANLDWNTYAGGILYVIDALPSGAACGWSGLGYIGFARAYANGTASLGVVGHEMGHNFGLYHAGSLRCGANVIAPSGCTVTEYGDPWSVMGNQQPGHFNAYQKDALNYLPGKVATHTSGSVTYTLGPIESPGQSLYAVQIPTSNTKRTYWVEFRQGIGMDAGLSGINALGAQVRVAYPFENQAAGYLPTDLYDDTQFLDMTPPSTFTDGALLNGQTYTDASTNVTIQVTAASASSLSVKVTTGGGGGGASTTTLASAANPSTQGQSVTFTASVTGTNPTGSVTFKDSGTTICNAVALVGSGNTRTAPCATSSLAVGVHSITASYGGRVEYFVVELAIVAVGQGNHHDRGRELAQSIHVRHERHFHRDRRGKRADRQRRVHERRRQHRWLHGAGPQRRRQQPHGDLRHAVPDSRDAQHRRKLCGRRRQRRFHEPGIVAGGQQRRPDCHHDNAGKFAESGDRRRKRHLHCHGHR